MAITNGITISCSDLMAVGGIRTILIRSFATGDTITYNNTSALHEVTSITDTTGPTATWYAFEFKDQNPALTVTAAKENGSTSYDCSLSFMMPEMDNLKGALLQQMMDTCIMAIAIGNNDKYYCLGISQKYENEKVTTRNQTFASMTGAEGTTGAAYDDDSGWTVTLGCKQWEAPRLYTGTIVLYTSGQQATTT